MLKPKYVDDRRIDRSSNGGVCAVLVILIYALLFDLWRIS